jgi:hypothetical protein
MDIVSIQAIEHRHTGHFFSTGSMRFFNSRRPQQGYKVGNKAYFITSEQFDYKSPRLYTLRVINWDTGVIDTVGEFNQMTKSQAQTALKNAVKESEAVAL